MSSPWGCLFAGRNNDNADAARVLSGQPEMGKDVLVLGRQLAYRLHLFTKAFDMGIIEYKRVLEVTVLPFMKLAQKCQHPKADSPHLRDSAPEILLSCWADALGTSLCWHSKSMPERAAGLAKPAMQASKRAEMVKAMMSARIHEVRSSAAWFQQVVVSWENLCKRTG